MKIKFVSLLTVMAFALALSFSSPIPAAPRTSASAAVPAAAAQPSAEPAAAPEPHPEIREAIGALRRAKAHLENAAHDFGGHRVEALKATDEAIRQLELALKFDKN